MNIFAQYFRTSFFLEKCSIILLFFLLLIALFLLLSCSQNPAPVSHYGLQKGAGSSGIHTVRAGENLWDISKRYKISMQAIALKNNLDSSFKLSPGQRIKLPPPMEYIVREGDTLYEVSRLLGINVSDFSRLNNLSEPYKLYKGQVLRVPSIATMRSASEGLKSIDKNSNSQAQSAAKLQQAQKKKQQSSEDKQKNLSHNFSSGLKQAKKIITPPSRSSGKFKNPVKGKVVSKFGPKKNGLHNDGVNILASKGSHVLAAENGVVVYTGNALKGSGNLILLKHQDQFMSAYAHLDTIKVQKGDLIKKGQVIGSVGSTGNVSQPQLHFELRKGTKAVNPSSYLEG